MIRYNKVKIIRMDEMQQAKCDVSAAKERVTFCAWARDAFQQKLDAEARRAGKRKVRT